VSADALPCTTAATARGRCGFSKDACRLGSPSAARVRLGPALFEQPFRLGSRLCARLADFELPWARASCTACRPLHALPERALPLAASSACNASKLCAGKCVVRVGLAAAVSWSCVALVDARRPAAPLSPDRSSPLFEVPSLGLGGSRICWALASASVRASSMTRAASVSARRLARLRQRRRHCRRKHGCWRHRSRRAPHPPSSASASSMMRCRSRSAARSASGHRLSQRRCDRGAERGPSARDRVEGRSSSSSNALAASASLPRKVTPTPTAF